MLVMSVHEKDSIVLSYCRSSMMLCFLCEAFVCQWTEDPGFFFFFFFLHSGMFCRGRICELAERSSSGNSSYLWVYRSWNLCAAVPRDDSSHVPGIVFNFPFICPSLGQRDMFPLLYDMWGEKDHIHWLVLS